MADRLRFNLALAYYKSSRIAEAIPQFQSLHNANPADLGLAMLLADSYLQTGQFPEAVDLLKPLTVPPEDRDAVDYVLGMALIRGGNVAEGQVHVDRILSRGESAEGHFLLGPRSLWLGLSGGGAGIAKAAALNPKVPSLQSYYGRALLFTGDADGAAEAFRKELAAIPTISTPITGSPPSSPAAGLRSPTSLERAVELRPASAEARAALEHGFSQTSRGPGVPVGAAAPSVGALDLGGLRRPAYWSLEATPARNCVIPRRS